MRQTCDACGYTNRDGARFCARCGRSLEGQVRRRSSLRPGQYLRDGDYQVLGPLSKGGMGAVYLARDMRAFERPCVIKEMLDYYDCADPQARARAEARFMAEARTLASLSHPGIPKIYAFFQEAGRYYIVMEYILGENLEQYVTHVDGSGRQVSKQPISEEEILRYAIQACLILEYLADQPRPVVHQDIKPANLIRERVVGDVRLVDFGTAWTRRTPTASLPGVQMSSVYGTRGYASPEQCQGNPVPRSDVYSLAATIYHLLTDDDPRDHPGHFPKLASLRPDLRAALEQALRPDPTTRSTARQLREHLEAACTPRRVLEAFVFPGGDRIHSAGALPAMCDKHWRAACEYLYDGDFERWLRDLNRLDLVEIAKAVRQRYRNHDAGLEAFLRRMDPGLPPPKLAVNPAEMDVGQVHREENITMKLELSNAGRGYTRATVKSTTPWLQVQPRSAGLRAGELPVSVVITVRTHQLPLRGRHRGVIEIHAGRAGRLFVPVTVQTSVWRELGHIFQRAWRGALPAAVQGLQAHARQLARLARRLGDFGRRRWRWMAYVYSAWGALACLGWWLVARAEDPASYAFIALLSLPTAFSVASLSVAVPFLIAGAMLGATKGIWQTFRK